MTADNKAIVRKFFEEAWDKGNWAVLDECLASHRVLHSHGGTGPLLPFNPEAEKERIISWRTAFPDSQRTVRDLIAEGDKVVADIPFSGTHTGFLRWERLMLPPTGKQINVGEVAIFRLEGGKMVEAWYFWDRLELLQQLGVTGPGEDQRAGAVAG